MSSHQIQITVNAVDNASKVIRKLTNSTSNLSSKFSSLGKVAQIAGGILVGAGVLGAFQKLRNEIDDTVKTFAEFEYQMKLVKNIMGLTSEEYSEMTEKVKKLAAETIYSARDLSNALTDIARTGIKGDQALAVLENAAKASQAAGEDLNNVLNVAISIVKTYGLSVEETSSVMDKLLNSALNAKTTVTDLGTALSYVAPVAKQVGWSLDELLSALALLQDRGMEASKAGTYLRQALMKLTNPTKKALEELKKFHIELYKVTEIKEKDIGQVVDEIPVSYTHLTLPTN